MRLSANWSNAAHSAPNCPAPAGVTAAVALVSAEQEGDSYTVVLKNLQGDVAPVNEELQLRGFNATINLEATSPSGVGRLLSSGGTSGSALQRVKVTYTPGR